MWRGKRGKKARKVEQDQTGESLECHAKGCGQRKKIILATVQRINCRSIKNWA